MSWGLELSLWLVGLLVLLVVFVAVLLRPPRAVHLWAVALTRYDEPLPPNAYAHEDLLRFEVDFESDNQLFVVPAEDIVAVFRREPPPE